MSANVIELTSVRDTELWRSLAGECSLSSGQRTQNIAALAGNIYDICAEASERAKLVLERHPEFTLHDDRHLLRVTWLMGKILGKHIDNLNFIEKTALVLAAFFHDQGMILTNKEYERLEQDPEWIAHRESWAELLPNLRQLQELYKSTELREQERKRISEKESELRAAIFRDYIRSTHGRRSAEFVRENYSTDPRWIVAGTNLSEIVAKLCESHVMPCSEITPINGFNYDESIGSCEANLCYLAMILRISDILDLDRDRTPVTLYQSIHFTNEVSVTEWEKHRSVDGWKITPNCIRFTMNFEHPEYERAARSFMDMIDNELSSAHRVVRSFPSEFTRYKLEIPERVDRSRIGPKGNLYIYHDLEFSISRDEAAHLLADEFYSHPFICIRELLQNSLDALRYRKAVHQAKRSSWEEGKIFFEHGLDENGYEFLRCTDNGIGMTEGIIANFLTKIGKSFYKSPEFERENLALQQANVCFSPNAQFGIGFLSCLMIGDRITISTRRDRGPDKGLDYPWIVEINGLGGIIVIRRGLEDQKAGTDLTITMRRKPSFFDEYVDEVRLAPMLRGYALATEFPIHGRCSIREIESDVKIPTSLSRPVTALERMNLEMIRTVEQDLASVDKRLNGTIRQSFLVDQSGRLTMDNNEARITRSSLNRWSFEKKGADKESEQITLRNHFGQICTDGILVTGPPGRDSQHEPLLGSSGPAIVLGSPFIVDVRGNMRPKLTPARRPPDSLGAGDLDVSWKKLRELLHIAEGRLWEKVLKKKDADPNPAIPWKLACLYHAELSWMPRASIMRRLSLPFRSKGAGIVWRRLEEIGKLVVADNGLLKTLDEKILDAGPELSDLGTQSTFDSPINQMRSIAILISKLSISNGLPLLDLGDPRKDEDEDIPALRYLLIQPFGRTPLIDYFGSARDAISVACEIATANLKHPLVRLAFESKHFSTPNAMVSFATSVVQCLSTSSVLTRIDKGEKPNRWMKSIGWAYKELNWNAYDEALRPPYRIWTKNRSWVDISGEEISAWAEESEAVD